MHVGGLESNSMVGHFPTHDRGAIMFLWNSVSLDNDALWRDQQHTCASWQYGNFGFPTGCSMEIRFSYYSARFRTIRTGRGFFLKSRPAPPPVAPGEGVNGSRGPRFRTGFVLVSYYPYWPKGFVPWSRANYPCRSRRLIGHTANS